MLRTSQEWRAYVQNLADWIGPSFERAGLPLTEEFVVEFGGTALVSYDASARAVVLGFDEADAAPAYRRYGALLSTTDDAELDRLLDLLVARLTMNAFGRHLRTVTGTASEDAWLEEQVANAVAYAATSLYFEPHRPFLVETLGRAVASLQERRLLGLPLPDGQPDPAMSPEGERLLYQLIAFFADAQRTDVPNLDLTLQALVASSGLAQRRMAESELVLLHTFTEGPPALRRTAAELFAEEASAESIAKLLAGGRMMPPDVRLMLAVALLERGATGDANDYLTALATSTRTPPSVAAAAALLVNDPVGAGVDAAAMLSQLEDAGLRDALKLLKVLPSSTGATAVWPLLAHPSAAVRKEAYRLLGAVLPESDAWTGIADPEPSIRAASVMMLSSRPGLSRAVAKLLLDEDQAVRRAALIRARTQEGLAQDVGTLLMAQENDESRRAAAAVVADRAPSWADKVFGTVLARAMKPYTLAVAAAMAADPWNRDLKLVEQLGFDALSRARRETLTFAAEARGRADWLAAFAVAEQGQDRTAQETLSMVLPDGWHEALYAVGEEFDPLFALRQLAVTHPDAFVRAAILLWLARSGHDDAAKVATIAEQDPTQTVSEVAPIVRVLGSGEPMALTAIEKALFLRTVPLFRSVPTQSLLAVGGAMVVTNHQSGEAIVKQGEIGDRLFVLYEGSAQAERENPDGTKTTLASLSTGAVFGEMSLFDLEPRSATVVAQGSCQSLMLDGQTFHRLGVQYPEILWEVCRVLSQRLRLTDQHLGSRRAERPTAA
jgi:hypothetical protein